MRIKSYYIADDIITDLHTTGSEWQLTNGTEYIGPYHTYSTGEVYTMPNWNPIKSEKLEEFISKSVIYDQLTNIQTTYKSIVPYKVVITNEDIKRGFIYRYFIKKVNELIIYEIDEKQYEDWQSQLIDPNLYVAVEILWGITGNLEDTIKDNISITSVATKNKKQIETVKNTIPELGKYLTNLTEFFVDTNINIPSDINQSLY